MMMMEEVQTLSESNHEKESKDIDNNTIAIHEKVDGAKAAEADDNATAVPMEVDVSETPEGKDEMEGVTPAVATAEAAAAPTVPASNAAMGDVDAEKTPSAPQAAVSDVVNYQNLAFEEQKALYLQEKERRAEEMAELAKTGNKRKRGEKTRVGFCPEVLVFHNPRKMDEIITSWYTRDELSNFKGERKHVIRALKKVDFDLNKIDKRKYQLRGLEAYLSVSFNKFMQQKRAQVIQTVMSEQKTQKSSGKGDSESLRSACCTATEWARRRAFEMGKKDAVEVYPHVYPGAAAGASPMTEDPSCSWGHDSDVSSLAPSLCSSTSASSASSSSTTSDNTYSAAHYITHSTGATNAASSYAFHHRR